MSQIEINVRIWGSSVNSFYKLSYSVCLTFAYFMKLFSLAKRRSTYAVDSILTLMTYLSIHTTNLWSALLKEVKPEAHQLQAVPWILLPVIALGLWWPAVSTYLHHEPRHLALCAIITDFLVILLFDGLYTCTYFSWAKLMLVILFLVFFF